MTYAVTVSPRGTVLGNEAMRWFITKICVFAVSDPEFGDLKEEGKTNLFSNWADREPAVWDGINFIILIFLKHAFKHFVNTH